jgi:hypothetical protein
LAAVVQAVIIHPDPMIITMILAVTIAELIPAAAMTTVIVAAPRAVEPAEVVTKITAEVMTSAVIFLRTA